MKPSAALTSRTRGVAILRCTDSHVARSSSSLALFTLRENDVILLVAEFWKAARLAVALRFCSRREELAGPIL